MDGATAKLHTSLETLMFNHLNFQRSYVFVEIIDKKLKQYYKYYFKGFFLQNEIFALWPLSLDQTT